MEKDQAQLMQEFFERFKAEGLSELPSEEARINFIDRLLYLLVRS